MGNFIAFIGANFLHIAPILISGALAIAIMIERSNVIFMKYPLKNRPAFFEKIRDLIMSDRLSEALTLCERYHSKPIVQVVKEARAHQPEDLIEEGLALAMSEATAKMQLRRNYLATIANVSTFLGLLGTIIGLIQSFEAVGSASAQQRSALLAAGISSAMNATMMGLAVAILCMILYSFITNKTNQLITEVEQSGLRMMDLIKQRYYSSETEPFGTPSSKNHSERNFT